MPTAFSYNFMIDAAAVAFTDIKGSGDSERNQVEIKRIKRYEREILNRKEVWVGNTVGMFEK